MICDVGESRDDTSISAPLIFEDIVAKVLWEERSSFLLKSITLLLEMSRHAENQTMILSQEDTASSIDLPSNLDAGPYEHSCGVIPQRPHQPSYLRRHLSQLTWESAGICHSRFPRAVPYSTKTKEVMEPNDITFRQVQPTCSAPPSLHNLHSQAVRDVELVNPSRTHFEQFVSDTNLLDDLNFVREDFSEATEVFPTRCFSPLVGSPMRSAVNVASKRRIRWTEALHRQFVEAVDHLGGAEKKTGRRNQRGVSQFNQLVDRGLPISQALHLQMDAQKSLYEHLEFQQNLQMRIEEQARRLQCILDEHRSSKLPMNQNLKISEDEPFFKVQSIERHADNSGDFLIRRLEPDFIQKPS
ncbi:hypothetical protein ACLOJK_030315 [Asimina triloba]